MQYYGYDKFQYVNVRYPIPFNPPYVPVRNPAYHYSRSFEIEKAEELYLVFEGVDSCFYVYINGKYVGFSQISHKMSEFNITEYVHLEKIGLTLSCKSGVRVHILKIRTNGDLQVFFEMFIF